MYSLFSTPAVPLRYALCVCFYGCVLKDERNLQQTLARQPLRSESEWGLVDLSGFLKNDKSGHPFDSE